MQSVDDERVSGVDADGVDVLDAARLVERPQRGHRARYTHLRRRISLNSDDLILT